MRPKAMLKIRPFYINLKNNILIKEYLKFYLKIIFLTFWDAKLLIKLLYLRFVNMLLSIDKMVNLFSLSCDIVDRILLV